MFACKECQDPMLVGVEKWRKTLARKNFIWIAVMIAILLIGAIVLGSIFGSK